MHHDITIGICTFKRPFLEKTLESVKKAIEYANAKVNVLIVDNDPNQSARQLVCSMTHKQTRFTYVSEPRSGIAFARNRVLSETNTKWLLFIDDDETVDKEWLLNYINIINGSDFTAAIGPVVTQYPNYVDDVIVKSRVLDRRTFPHLNEINHGATNNCLIDLEFANKNNIKFDTDFNFYGEDSDFFERISKTGKIIWNQHSIVYEPVTKDRARKEWIVSRLYKNGYNYARRKVIRCGPKTRFTLLIKSIIRVFIDVVKYIINFHSKPLRFKYLCELYRDFGRIKSCIMTTAK
ncbi:Glycosyl transferase family 2 [Grimontia celer]|uniref:Glycosyl transferase family 2 n=1 Tax=Grimontia celer TaxID=1796497 RepID=A0A128F0H3_9GAMM|nr:glycosyltransferase [Grimontia celer]CZF80045.1 Glycosyl transferase family 2 [Grimontia celer]